MLLAPGMSPQRPSRIRTAQVLLRYEILGSENACVHIVGQQAVQEGGCRLVCKRGLGVSTPACTHRGVDHDAMPPPSPGASNGQHTTSLACVGLTMLAGRSRRCLAARSQVRMGAPSPFMARHGTSPPGWAQRQLHSSEATESAQAHLPARPVVYRLPAGML